MMIDSTVHAQAKLLRDYLNQLNIVMEEYAKQMGLSYTSLNILSFIYSSEEPCTQKMICEHVCLPKQTVNSIITNFYRAGLVELRELPKDRRNKAVRLTELGQKYAQENIAFIHQAELSAMEKLDHNLRTALLEGTKRYKESFQSLLQQNGKGLHRVSG